MGNCTSCLTAYGAVKWKYDTSSRDEYGDKWWMDSSILFEDGFIYLIDDKGITVDKISKGYCYFKARNVQYHIIPD